MNITNHAKKRWQERVMSAENPDQAILEAFHNAEKIWHEVKDGKRTDYYLKDDIVFAVADEAIITVFKTDYGLGDNINKIITSELLEELNKAKKTYAQRSEEIETEVINLQRQAKMYDLQIEAMQARVKAMEATREKLRVAAEALEEEARQLQAEVDAIAKKLVYSVSWRLEELASKGKKTA